MKRSRIVWKIYQENKFEEINETNVSNSLDIKIIKNKSIFKKVIKSKSKIQKVLIKNNLKQQLIMKLFENKLKIRQKLKEINKTLSKL
nr:hypothetical protein [Entomoplasma sp. MP1]